MTWYLSYLIPASLLETIPSRSPAPLTTRILRIRFSRIQGHHLIHLPLWTRRDDRTAHTSYNTLLKLDPVLVETLDNNRPAEVTISDHFTSIDTDRVRWSEARILT